jgi:N-acetylated-alpha-linked acidic dipeptidase
LKRYLDTLNASLIHETKDDVHETKKVKLESLEDAIYKLSKYASKLDSKAQDLMRHPQRQVCYLRFFCIDRHRAAEIERVNKAYLEFERGFLGKGLPGRPVYKHVVYAPGTWEGYAGFTFPSIREAIADHRWEEAGEQVKEIAHLLKKAGSKMLC